MKKSTVIAKCLVKLGGMSLEDAEHAVFRTFQTEFPNDDFHCWNTEVNNTRADTIIQAVGTPMWIDVANFIRDLW